MVSLHVIYFIFIFFILWALLLNLRHLFVIINLLVYVADSFTPIRVEEIKHTYKEKWKLDCTRSSTAMHPDITYQWEKYS